MKETRALDFRSSNDRRLALTQPVDVGATTEATARLRDRYWQDKRGVWRSRESGRVVSRARINRARAQYLYHARMRALAAQREISITEAKKLWRADPDAAMESLGQSPRGTGPEDPAIPDDLGPGGEL